MFHPCSPCPCSPCPSLPGVCQDLNKFDRAKQQELDRLKALEEKEKEKDKGKSGTSDKVTLTRLLCFAAYFSWPHPSIYLNRALLSHWRA